ncbi:MAG: hypothetical protein GYB21_06020 [Oceanospirillales bacterium]|nr:hypothetical protein [Oceanospirillales bacterium]
MAKAHPEDRLANDLGYPVDCVYSSLVITNFGFIAYLNVHCSLYDHNRMRQITTLMYRCAILSDLSLKADGLFERAIFHIDGLINPTQ